MYLRVLNDLHPSVSCPGLVGNEWNKTESTLQLKIFASSFDVFEKKKDV
jgi:hypothetical protein